MDLLVQGYVPSQFWKLLWNCPSRRPYCLTSLQQDRNTHAASPRSLANRMPSWMFVKLRDENGFSIWCGHSLICLTGTRLHVFMRHCISLCENCLPVSFVYLSVGLKLKGTWPWSVTLTCRCFSFVISVFWISIGKALLIAGLQKNLGFPITF